MNASKAVFLASPLNYTGGKFRLLGQILPLLPDHIETFHDVFCGGANVLANVSAHHYTGFDIQPDLVRVLSYLARTPGPQVLRQCDELIKAYGLTQTHLYGYSHYGADSSAGLAHVNRSAYARLRKDYACVQAKAQASPQDQTLSNNAAAHFLVLISYAFNNQIRFGRNGFNIPVGKRDLNARQRAKILSFSDALSRRDVSFAAQSYDKLDLAGLSSSDLVYADPPYLISTASYNEQGGWGREQEKKLLTWLERVSETGARFALSNVMVHKGQSNDLLSSWCAKNNWRVEPIKASYSNSSYQLKDKTATNPTQEVLVLNY